jgi:UDP-N-acetylglucosamine 2-epimerase (non-hydrolysing)
VKLLSVVGARPQFIKLKPMVEAARGMGVDHRIVHTGQHYDPNMSDSFFTGLRLPAPDVNLHVGSGTHGVQTAAMLVGLEKTFGDMRPDWVIVYGDTNSTLAGALAAVKMGIPVAHVEAGLRSFNRNMPEEINRVASDHVCDVLFAPTDMAMANLRNEGLEARSVQVGDVMADVMRLSLDDDASEAHLGIDGPFLVATIHRPSNTDDPMQLTRILSAMSGLEVPVVLVAHPRLRAQAKIHGLDMCRASIRVIEPLPYREMLSLVRAADGVVTDSGGLQKEAFLLGVPCTTIRTETEWPETFEGGMNVLDPLGVSLRETALREPGLTASAPFGDGHAAEKIVSFLVENGRVTQ